MRRRGTKTVKIEVGVTGREGIIRRELMMTEITWTSGTKGLYQRLVSVVMVH